MGVMVGIYISQNYNIPNIHKIGEKAFAFAKTLEESLRKDNK